MVVKLVPLSGGQWEPFPLEWGVAVRLPAEASLADVLAAAQRECPRAFETEEGQEESGRWATQLIRASAWEPVRPAFAGDPVPVYVDESGGVRWHVPESEATLLGLRRTVATGVLDARTDTLGYWLRLPVGNGGHVELLDLWQVFVPFITLWFLQPLWSAVMDRLVGVLEARWRQWRDRGGSPRDWADLVLARPRWTSAELGRLLGVTDEEAEACLEGLSYRRVDATSHEIAIEEGSAPSTLVLRLTSYRHVAWFRAFPPEAADRVAASNPDLPLAQDLAAYRRALARDWEGR